MKNITLFPKRLSLLGIVLFALFFFSCSRDDVNNNGTLGNSVSFKVSIEQSLESRASTALSSVVSSDVFEVEGDAEEKLYIIDETTENVRIQESRATIVSSIKNEFSVSGHGGATEATITQTPDWFYNEKIKPGTNGTTSIPYNWNWTSLRYGRFYAVYPYVASSDTKLSLSPQSYSGVPYLNFEVEHNVRQQRDLMTATTDVIHYATENVQPVIPLSFKHALTAISFRVGDLNSTKTINKIVISNAYSKGKFQLPSNATDRGTWSEHSDRVDFTLDNLSISTSAHVGDTLAGKYTDNLTFYMLPQTLTNNNVKLQVFFKDQTSISATLRGEWKAGTKKSYMLSSSSTNSDWTYTLTVTSPAAIKYDGTTTEEYSILSFRKNTLGISQPVSWAIVGYDNNDDNTYSMNEKPEWLTALSLSEGVGGGLPQKGKATIDAASYIFDLREKRENELKTAATKGNNSTPNSYFNLSNESGVGTIDNTANSYIISAPGYYRIPLVYGNGIKNGNPNESSWKTNNTGDRVLSHFRDHNDALITSPYINVQNSGSKATTASILWQDETDLVTNISVYNNNTEDGSDDFLQFEVSRANIKPGNAVVVIKDASGTIMWSWHLWFTTADAVATIDVTNFQNVTNKLTRENLGWKYDTWRGSIYRQPRSVKIKVQQGAGPGGVKKEGIITITQNDGGIFLGTNTFYQYGRKDAFPGVDIAGLIQLGGAAGTIPNTIKNPTTYYSQMSYPVKSSTMPPYNLWSMEYTTAGLSDTPPVKTIYDPCPVGFKLPSSRAFTGFTTTGGNVNTYNNSEEIAKFNIRGEWNLGYEFYNKPAGANSTATLYFPASGYRSTFNSLKIVSSQTSTSPMGLYWSASMTSATGNSLYALMMQYRVYLGRPREYLSPVYDSAGHTNGTSIRPMAE